MSVCSRCATENEPGRKFCGECGHRLSITCAACGTANAADAKFCGDCGAALRASEAPSRLPAVAGPALGSETERRLVSVLFVDLVGFTSFSEGRDAEDVRAMLTRYFDAASDAVARHGGRVEKFIGDAVMAVWGTPIAHEDDAERAVRSALEIVDRVEAIGVELAIGLTARAGVLTGEAVAVRDAVDQGFVTGDMVNTAARLQSAAEPGTVLVGEKTYNSVSVAIACEPVEPLSLKGKSERLPAWQALRVISEVGGANRGAAPEPPFGGRDEQLRLTKELLHATGREGRPRLLHVAGVAGIGKSRLVWELQKYVDGLTEGFLWHQGRCPSYGDGVSFWALAEMVRGRAGIADTDDDETARAALHDCVSDYVPDDEERRWIEPRLASLIGLDGASGEREEMFGAWRSFLERVAERGTTVLVIEDLHWADAGLMDFVESVLEWSRSSPIIVITLGRPELGDRRPGWGAGMRSVTTLHLDRLTDAEIEAMVTGYVEGLPVAGLARLVSRAEGVPMYAVETVRMLASRGVLEQRGSSYLAVGDLGGELDIPETLHALVAARLDSLPEPERLLVQDASVAGHSFTLDAVCAVSGSDAAVVEPRLRALVRKEVLDQDVDPRSAERGQYRFVQAVIHEVAYSTLSKASRRTKHLACAQWLEGLDEDELAGVVASHYLDAYRSDPSSVDADVLASRARAWLMRAGERSVALGAPEQGLSYALLGLTLASQPSERAPLHELATRSSVRLHDFAVTWEHLVAGCADYQAAGDLLGEARLLAGVARYAVDVQNLDELTERQLDVERRLPESCVAERVLLLSAVSDRFTAAHDGDEAAGLEYSERALVLAQTLDDASDPAALREALVARAIATHTAGRHLEARLLHQEAVAMAHRSGSPRDEARALMIFGVTQWEDDPRASLDAMLECAVVARIAGMRGMQSLALANAAEGSIDLGEWEQADRVLAEYAGLSTGHQQEDEGTLLSGALLLAFRDDPAAALALLAPMDDRADSEWGMRDQHTWMLRVRSLCRLLGGDATASAADAATSLELSPAGVNAPASLWLAVITGGALRDEAAIRAALGATSGLRGRWVGLVRATADAVLAALVGDEDGPDRMGAALESWTSAQLPLDHAWATLCALHVLPTGGVPGGHVVSARTYLEGLGARPMLALLDSATA